MIVWLTGNSGSGKSTLTKNMIRSFPHAIILDGDEMRETISVGLGFSKEDREEHNLRVARLAKLFSDANHLVLVSVITPYESLREKISTIANPIWVYVTRGIPPTIEKPYELPSRYDLIIDNSILSIQEAKQELINFILRK